MSLVFVVAHKDIEYKLPNGYMPILAGANKNSANIPLCDNTGDNISSKNSNYCELTAQYWVWKNYEPMNFVGFVHYRRFFFSSRYTNSLDRILSAEELFSNLQNYQAVLPEPLHLLQSIGEQYKKLHNADDLIKLRMAVNCVAPSYVDAFDSVMQRRTLFAYNMFVLPWDLYANYMTWLFAVLNEVEKHIEIDAYSQYDSRVFGFMSERLLNVWVEKNKVDYCCLPVAKTDAHATLERVWDDLKGLTIR